ncbi:MAG: thioredoxin-disulfide reductase [Candidatus Kerfeldbacteria bacterium]|nr:thioredoxin-disulfide reductase [Candidatus Kerfeldbacteria bacterium]
MVTTRLLILGSGPAGYTAAIYAARADLAPIVLSGPEPGGQLMWTTEVENYPGFPRGILGPDLMTAMKEQAERFGASVVPQSATRVDVHHHPWRVWTDHEEYQAECLVVATGASAKWLNFPNEQRLRGKGVSACATCDGFFFRGQDVVVIGGGDSAMEEALFLTKFANQVTVLVRADKLRASKIMAHRAEANTKISWRFNTEVVDVLGQELVTGVRVKDTLTGATTDMAAHGMFLAIGHQPNTSLFRGQLQLDDRGYLTITNQVFSSQPGVFIAGDVADFRYRQAVTAAGWGCMAAIEAERYLSAGRE